MSEEKIEKKEEVQEQPVEVVEKPSEEKVEEVVEEVKEEPKKASDDSVEAEPAKEEAEVPAEEPVVEEKPKAEEVKEEPAVEEPKPDVSVEQLSIIKEVRKELANSYTEMKTLRKTNEQLSVESDNIKLNLSQKDKDIEKLSIELKAYKAREDAIEKAQMVKRLEQLSASFAKLGQNKTVEHLSKLDNAVIAEFEEITNIALSNKTNEQLDAVTVPSQAVVQKTVVAQSAPKKLTDKDFFGGLCGTLVSQQDTQGGDSKRIINM